MIFLSNFKKRLTIFCFSVFRDYRNSPVQVTTGYQLPVRNYLMPLRWPVGEQRRYILLIQIHEVRSPLGISCPCVITRNLWTKAYKQWYLVSLIQKTD
uniref:DAZ domain-containing protein n=1 Tax=Piliocolobus tephrosceles TaxID=591936 RepID=A0A8C9ILN3_9PRIM